MAMSGVSDTCATELFNESLSFGLDHARCAIATRADDYNHSLLGYQSPASYAVTIAATGSKAVRDKASAGCLHRAA